MPEHRPILDPTILGRLSTSMVQFEQAWLADVTELRRVEAKMAAIERLLNSATDRASALQGDLRAARQENADLIRRNAHLEAQVQKLYENSLDAKDALEHLAARAVEAARTAPPAESQWRDPEKIPPGEEDAPPEFMRRPAADADTPRGAVLPINQFSQSRQAAQ